MFQFAKIQNFSEMRKYFANFFLKKLLFLVELKISVFWLLWFWKKGVILQFAQKE